MSEVTRPRVAREFLGPGDALIIVDVQSDFLPGGALGVPRGDEVVAALSHHAAAFAACGLPVVATADWHPPDHCSFTPRGGAWPPHCVAGSPGARFADALTLPPDVIVIHKATSPARDAYSGFQGTDLAPRLRALGVGRLFVGGLATDYCVRETVLDARREGFAVVVLEDAVRAVDLAAGDGTRALRAMTEHGAVVRRDAERAVA